MNLIIQLATQLKEMENEMDKVVQEKKASMEAIPVTAIPTITTIVPYTSSTPVATTVPVATMVSTTSTTTPATYSTSSSHPSDQADKLIKSMQDVSIQTTEINRMKEHVKNLEDENKLAQMRHTAKAQKSSRLTDKVQKLERELTLAEPLAQSKQQLWANIINFFNDIWPSIQVIFEQKNLIKEASEAVQKVKEELGKKLEEAIEIIKFLNSKNKQEL